MQNVDESKMTVRILVCPKCRRHVGKVIDEVYLRIGDALIYNELRFSCCCGRNLYFKEKTVETKSLTGESKKILNRLGLQNKSLRQDKKKG